MSIARKVHLFATAELLRLREMPLGPIDREAVQREIAARAPAAGAESKDQITLFGDAEIER